VDVCVESQRVVFRHDSAPALNLLSTRVSSCLGGRLCLGFWLRATSMMLSFSFRIGCALSARQERPVSAYIGTGHLYTKQRVVSIVLLNKDEMAVWSEELS
jgi:hypothetical protein